METSAVKKWTGPEDDVLGVLRMAALAGGLSLDAESVPHPYGRGVKTWRFGPVLLWKDTSYEDSGGTPVWTTEIRREGEAVRSKHTYADLYAAAADTVSLVVREKVVLALRNSFGPVVSQARS